MQFELLLQSYIDKSGIIQTLTAQLKNQQQKCLKNAKTDAHIRHCGRDREDYERYLKLYGQQFVEKGVDICGRNLVGSLEQKVQERRKCVLFYMKSFGVFEENVKDKLNSLIHKLDYVQL